MQSSWTEELPSVEETGITQQIREERIAEYLRKKKHTPILMSFYDNLLAKVTSEMNQKKKRARRVTQSP